MKLCILNDTHIGIRNGADIFLDSAERFYTDVLFPYLEREGIKTILHLGDYYDHRKYVSYKVLNRDYRIFLRKLKELGITMHIIPGNHDVFYKNTNEVSSLQEILGRYEPSVRVHMEPTVLEFDSLQIGVVPWICAENEAKSLEFIRTCSAPFLGLHADIRGFEMLKGHGVNETGFDPELFSRYESVLVGHYHTKSSAGNINYLGTQLEFTWADAGDPKFFHILDTETRTLTPVANPNTIFKKVVYDDTESPRIPNWLSSVHIPSDLGGCFVKVVVANKGNPMFFDRFLDRIQKQAPFEIKVVESFAEFTAAEVEDASVSLEDTETLLKSYTDALETDLDKSTLKSRLSQLYAEAQALEIA